MVFFVGGEAASGAEQLALRTDIGLSQVNNTADMDKPVSTAMQTALGLMVSKTALAAPTGASAIGISGGGSLDQLVGATQVGVFTAISSVTVPPSVKIIATSGFSTAGRGAATYYRTGFGAATAYRKQSADGAWWQLCDVTSYTLAMFGDNTDNYSQALIEVEKYFSEGFAGDLNFPSEIVRVPRTIYFPIGVSIYGVAHKTQVYPRAGAVYTDDVMFRLNLDVNGAWVMPYPNSRTPVVQNLYFRNDLDMNLRAIEFGGGYSFSRINAVDYCQLAAAYQEYTDQITFDNCTLNWRPSPVGWASSKVGGFGSGQFGDGFSMRNCHSVPFGATTPAQKAAFITLRLNQCRGATISDHINGLLQFTTCEAATVAGGHFEDGGVHIVQSNVTIRDTVFYNGFDVNGRSPITSTVNETSSGSTLDLNNVTFTTQGNLVNSYATVPSILTADVRLASRIQATVRNAYRNFGRAGSLGLRGVFGMMMADEAGTILSEWKSKPAACSIACRILRGGRVYCDAKISEPRASTLAVVANGNAGPFSDASGTYYYTYQLLYDADRLLGHNVNSAEVSAALVNGGVGALLTLASVNGVTLRLFRGSSAGSYDRFVDLPIVNSGAIYDYGSHCSGFPWTTRAAGPVGALAIPSFYGSAQWEGENIIATFPNAAATTVTSGGVWKIGDKVIFANSPLDGSGNRVGGLKRLTNGSGHVIGTDFILFYDSKA